jgi:hypothetical protein
MRYLLVAALSVILIVAAPDTGVAELNPQPITIKLQGLTARILSAKRARSWAGATSTGFTTSSAPEGREFIVLKYELIPAAATESLYLQYSKLEDTKGEAHFATGGSQGVSKESGARVVDQFYSVPAGTKPAALLLGRLGPPASGNLGDRPEWILAHRIELKAVPLATEK